MQKTSAFTFNDLVEKFLGNRLPDEMADLISMSSQPPEAEDFIMRLLLLMQQSGYPATSFTPYFVRWLATIKNMLPCAWGGQIPPLTVPNRHKKLDAYVINKQNRFNGTPRPVFLDMGCGFPPVTTSETAKSLLDWDVIGIDYSFPDYIVYNEEGHYACFSKDGKFQYFQALMTPSGRALYADPEETRIYFKKLFSNLQKADLAPHESMSAIVEKDGCRLIHNHVQSFETDNLSFIKSNICNVAIPPAKVIRGMNVYIYFEPETRVKMLNQAGELLDNDGIMIIGTNGLGIQTRYCIYEKNSQALTASEFAFSPDNLGPISFMPWFTIHENDPETLLLAELSKTIRSHSTYWPEFINDMEKSLKESELCWRRPDGFFQIPEQEMLYSEFMAKFNTVWQQMESKGYIDGAVKVLNEAGYEAWKNCVGDIAIKPQPDAMLN